jgi:predicted nucleotidyltransferase
MPSRVSQNKERVGGLAIRPHPATAPAAAAPDISPITPLVERIAARLAPEEIWLFGSRAEGHARPDSDYDLLAVLSDDAPESALDLMKAWELTCGLGVPAGRVPTSPDAAGVISDAAHISELIADARRQFAGG